jgi:hypothetical protein
VTYDDTFLFSVSQDGSLCVFGVKDRETRAAQREKEPSSIPQAKEIIITKGEIDELHHRISEINA